MKKYLIIFLSLMSILQADEERIREIIHLQWVHLNDKINNMPYSDDILYWHLLGQRQAYQYSLQIIYDDLNSY